MYKRVFVPICVASSIFASSALAEFKQIKTEAEYLSAFVGKKVMDDAGNTYQHFADGRFTGKVKSNGLKINGSWKWNGKYWCRNAVIGDRELGTDCQLVEVDGNKWRISRDKGRGRSVTGTIK